ncbi:MAG TPA: hypothetical protein VE621_22475, partial [Bryobacteraceae bacterium]|nr:hypothetical protein [Bryobacteraceae bacterium]
IVDQIALPFQQAVYGVRQLRPIWLIHNSFALGDAGDLDSSRRKLDKEKDYEASDPCGAIAGTRGLGVSHPAVRGRLFRSMSEVFGNLGCACHHAAGKDRHSVFLYFGDHAGDADGSHRPPLLIEHRRSQAASASIELFIIDGIAAAPDSFQFRLEPLRASDCIPRKPW